MNRVWAYRIGGGVFIFILLVISVFWMQLQSFGEEKLNLGAEPVSEYLIPPGTGLIRVANDLEKKGIISSAAKLRWLARFTGNIDGIKVGEYDLSPELTVNELLANMAEGKVKQYTLTLVEGWNFNQFIEAVLSHEKIEKTLPNGDQETVMAAIGHPGEHPEGRFLPDTYHFPIGTTDVNFLKRAYQAMESALEKEWQARNTADILPYEDAYQALIMASIVEKETAVPEEREQIAGVFVRRIQKRMRLQTDPTVIYGMGDKYKGNIRKSDLTEDTPYNTYTRRGLPPTPIAMPGREAIRAALNPEEGDALYFVAKGDGSHHFSATNEEHIRAVQKYQIRKRRQDYRSTPTRLSG
ncbi:MAG: endolytic transglycosylase MltG, partial [Gammaproteobacteria bacterium]|nr:endolytic transglycosylase MltG [Gammaproteobacteria bacterium]